MITTTFTSEDARKRWRDLLDMTYTDEAEVVIERYNKPVAVLINYDRYQAVKGLLHEMRTIRQVDKNLRAWLNDPGRGQRYSEFYQQLINEGSLAE